jgi:hypothetical protein
MGLIFGDDVNLLEFGSTFIENTKSDSFTSSIMNRVAIRDSITGCILGIKYPESTYVDICFISYLGFSISEIDSQKFKIELYPIGNGSIDNCIPPMTFEDYTIFRNKKLTDEYKKYKIYIESITSKENADNIRINTKLKQLTKHDLKKGCSLCNVFDSLGTACEVDYYSNCSGVFNIREGGIILKFPSYSLTFECFRIYCRLVNIYSNQDSINYNTCGYDFNRHKPSVNLLINNCKHN